MLLEVTSIRSRCAVSAEPAISRARNTPISNLPASGGLRRRAFAAYEGPAWAGEENDPARASRRYVPEVDGSTGGGSDRFGADDQTVAIDAVWVAGDQGDDRDRR